MNNKLREKIIEILKNRDMTSEEIMKEILKTSTEFSPMEFRETLADLVREGIIEKYPVYENKKFYFKLKKNFVPQF
ncbi:hypothetical protein [Acidianus brierleyi]|uniref:ArsR family transcriptional regulator n=1 Tax=Acidianus brierleyi TaxID=41673 RepID=A0A2U9IF53_9CREN|nr:hypothetical protein [Acidianus brierleyi]AWR94574.1 hypothetical protein DFR85_08175 [Acidianus brierleyi]